MSPNDEIGAIGDLNRIRSELSLYKSSDQRIKNTLESLKGIKGKEGISKAAKGFESLFVYMMLKEMRKTVPKNSLLGNSFGMDVYLSMLDEKIANRIAQSGKFGLSDMLIRHLEKKYKDKDEAVTDNLKELKTDVKLLPKAAVESNTKGLSISERVHEFLPIINEAAAVYKLDPDLLKAVIARESSGNPAAVSKNGAKGLMQLIDSTAADLDVQNVFDPKENIFAGARYLKELLVEHKGDLGLALAAYNAGPGAVKLYKGVPPYPETQNYIRKVTKLQKQFRSGERI